ncbi:DNA polymerase III subunit delta' C-terminal domain-containing protein [Haloferula sp. A504]|uniref:DNA polymerase III subunit delta' C-terminal domain-containing protein n=1 Tax=Haloferula sp. A504 TaxID=3373601 RepID=UPI0031C29494|nr:hypothetical protein [Verrucomicrobiaceae bacterium E54]
MAFTVDRAFELVSEAHDRQRLAHAFLIIGPRGSGKEELAARMIRMLQRGGGGGGSDLFGEPVKEEVPSLDELAGDGVRILRPQSKSRRITVDGIRELEKTFHVVSAPDAWKVGVIADADRMVAAAENAFLKTLEEPPPRTLLMLLTENAGGLLPTVLSRCVRLVLIGEPVLHEGGGAELLEALNSAAERGFGTPETALGLKAVFAHILALRKAEAEAAGKELLKEEEKALRQAVEGDWLKRREDSLKAVAESDYLADRERLFDVLQAWMADALRQKCGAGGLDFPDAATQTAKVASAVSLTELLRRVDALQELRSNLQTNAQEQLALEVGFLNAFG